MYIFVLVFIIIIAYFIFGYLTVICLDRFDEPFYDKETVGVIILLWPAVIFIYALEKGFNLLCESGLLLAKTLRKKEQEKDE